MTKRMTCCFFPWGIAPLFPFCCCWFCFSIPPFLASLQGVGCSWGRGWGVEGDGENYSTFCR